MDKTRLKALADRIIADLQSVLEEYGPFDTLPAEDRAIFFRIDAAHSAMVSVLLKIEASNKP